MCFSIPYKVIKVKNSKAFLEGGRNVELGSEVKVKENDYLQVIGNVAIGKLGKIEGLKIRRLIKKLNSHEPAN